MSDVCVAESTLNTPGFLKIDDVAKKSGIPPSVLGGVTWDETAGAMTNEGRGVGYDTADSVAVRGSGSDEVLARAASGAVGSLSGFANENFALDVTGNLSIDALLLGFGTISSDIEDVDAKLDKSLPSEKGSLEMGGSFSISP